MDRGTDSTGRNYHPGKRSHEVAEGKEKEEVVVALVEDVEEVSRPCPEVALGVSTSPSIPLAEEDSMAFAKHGEDHENEKETEDGCITTKEDKQEDDTVATSSSSSGLSRDGKLGTPTGSLSFQDEIDVDEYAEQRTRDGTTSKHEVECNTSRMALDYMIRQSADAVRNLQGAWRCRPRATASLRDEEFVRAVPLGGLDVELVTRGFASLRNEEFVRQIPLGGLEIGLVARRSREEDPEAALGPPDPQIDDVSNSNITGSDSANEAREQHFVPEAELVRPLPTPVQAVVVRRPAVTACLQLLTGIVVGALAIAVILVPLFLMEPPDKPYPKIIPRCDSERIHSLSAPFDTLHESVIKDILDDPCSSQGLAYKWMRQDPNLSTYSEERQIQRFVGVSAFLATGGSTHWKRNDGWMAYTDECEWYHANQSANDAWVSYIDEGEWNDYANPTANICDDNHVLRILNLTNNGLIGMLINELFIYTHAKVVDISHNNLSGTVPMVIQKAAGVEYLDYSHNNFTGGITTMGGAIFSLRVMKIQNNSFGPDVPQGVTFMPNLTYVDVSDNLFKGDIPDFFGTLKNLEVMKAARNKLSGTIGTSIGQVSKLRVLDFSGNIRLRGTLPQEMGYLTALEKVDVRNTNMKGPIPPGLCEKASAGTLELWVPGCGHEGGDGWTGCCP